MKNFPAETTPRAKPVEISDDELPMVPDEEITDEEILDENGEVTDKVWEEVTSGKNPTYGQLRKLEILNKGATAGAA